MFQRLPIALKQVKAGHAPESLLKETCQIIYSFIVRTPPPPPPPPKKGAGGSKFYLPRLEGGDSESFLKGWKYDAEARGRGWHFSYVKYPMN